jgi:hypothetical protein
MDDLPPVQRAHAGRRAAARRVTLTHAQVVVRLRERLERDSFPRLQMMLIVALTGGAGLLASYTLLQLGVTSMALRYPLALSLAYSFFLFLLWVWLRTRDDDGGFDLPDPDISLPARPSAPPRAASDSLASGRGGDFAGGGGGASFDDAAGRLSAPLDPLTASHRATGRADDGPLPDSLAEGLGDGLSSISDADELTIPLLVVALAVGLVLASLYVVWVAPVLFAELLADGALSYALYRRLRHEPRRHWLQVAFRRTVLPFAATAVFLAAVGWGLSAAAPGTTTLGRALDAILVK